jgi:hypothetical protein
VFVRRNAALLSDLVCVIERLRLWDQRQAPVAAETQRRVMRLRISLVMCWSFGLMATFGRMNCGIDYPPQRAVGQ